MVFGCRITCFFRPPLVPWCKYAQARSLPDTRGLCGLVVCNLFSVWRSSSQNPGWFRLIKFSSSGVVDTSTEGMPGKYKDEFWFYRGNSLRQMNIEKEMGGGYTVAKSEAPDRFTFMFWVSQNAKEQQPLYSPEKPNKCGPSE